MRRLAAIFTAVLFATSVAAVPARAQLDVDELSESEVQLLEIQAEIQAEIDAKSTALETARADLEIGRANVVLINHEWAAATHEDSVATDALRGLAIERYVLGDPRTEQLIDEIIQEKATVEPAIDRALYAQVLDSALESSEANDERLDDYEQQLTETKDAVAALETEVPVLENEVAELTEALTATETELAAIQAELEWERSLLRRARLTGLDDGTDNAKPVLAIKIDNVSAAKPQVGINQADVVFEELVEGELTRLVALFHSKGSDPVGPIRSVRTSDINILANVNRPLLANSGGNPGVMAALNDSPIVDVGALSPDAGPFFRDSSKRAPNNLMSNTTDLWAAGADTPAGDAPPMFSFRQPEKPWGGDATPASGVTINYGSTTARYVYDAATGTYPRTQDGSPHVDTNGVQVAPINVIVAVTDYSPTPFAALSPEAQMVGEGPVMVFAGGEMRTGIWRREAPEEPTRYLDNDGNEIELLPGNTWINLAPPDTATVNN